MKKRTAIIIHCIITFTMTVGIIHGLGEIVRPVNTDPMFNTIKTFHDMPHHSIEVIGYGSSHMWCSLDVMEMYKKYGIGAYNYGCDWQHINTTKLFLRDSLRTQSPKVVLIETYLVNELLQDLDMNGEIYYTKAIDEFDGKWHYLKQCFGNNMERWVSYYIPLCAFHDNWINLEKGNFLKNASSRNFYETMGFLYNEEITLVTIPEQSVLESENLSNGAMEILDEIVAICSEKDIKIIFYTAPYQGSYLYGNAMKQYAKRNGCVYFNLFEYVNEIGINEETDFSDEGHLNNSGAMKVADFLGEYIVNNYKITDMRRIENNLWEKKNIKD